MPPEFRYSDLQHSIQAQLERRLQSKTKVFCGVETKLETNYFGWGDKERQYQGNHTRVLFIGDSFLETMTTKPIAHRIEERINQAGTKIEVINFSQYNTSPEPEYRHRFHELAFDYNPEHIFIFLYSGNDLSTHYKYFPYRHQPFRVTKEAVNFLGKAGIEQRLANGIKAIHDSNRIFHSRLGLYDSLESIPSAEEQKSLAYLAALGFSQKHGPSISERFIPNTIIRFKNTRANISTTLKRIKKSRSNTDADCQCRSLDGLRDNYRAIFELPRGERLMRIAEFIASEYCGIADPHPILKVLERQDPWFINRIIEEPDSLDSLAGSLARAVKGKSKRKKTKTHRVESGSSEYVKLLSEFKETADFRGIGLTIVMIPVATNVDDTFLRCWEELSGRGRGEGRGPLMVTALKRKLDGLMNVLDLTEYPDEFQQGHWIFDGHWNERGSEAAARILTDYIAELGLFSKTLQSAIP